MERNRVKILLVDPNQKEGLLIRSTLARAFVPALVSDTSSTEEALRLISRFSFDLIFTENCPPKVNALKLLRSLQQRSVAVPVVLLSRDERMRTVRDAFRLGAHDFVLKEELEAVSLMDVITGVLEKVDRGSKAKETEQHLRDLASRDGLTQLYNHRYFLEALEKEMLRSHRFARPLSLLMIDLDGFKPINDSCGHPRGDQVLIQMARLIQQGVRRVDLVARYGGDEFAVLLPETDLLTAVRISERILNDIRLSPFLDAGRIYPLSASIGVASSPPVQGGGGAILRAADHALYEAKKSGRGCVVPMKRLEEPWVFENTPSSKIQLP